MKSTIDPQAPVFLAEAGRTFWTRVLREFELYGPSLELLALACKQADQAAEARAILAAQPLTYPDRFDQPREHPAVAIERNASVVFARLVRELALDVEPPADSRPPRRPGTC
jgi:phage terminase small subunit